MDIIQVITQELKVEKWQVEAAVKLIDEGNTIPFISRYRKEATGSLNDEQLRALFERLTYLRNLEDKKNQVLKSIEDQGKLTEELKKQILDAQTLVVVEDLYRPYRPKRRTRATIAKEKGLEPLADIILLQMTDKPVEEEARAYVSEEKGVKNVAEALNGAKDIIAERISDEADYRIYIRNLTTKNGSISSTAKNAETQSVYEMYYEFEEPVRKLAGHRILALNRGEKEKFITVKVNAPEEDILRYLNKRVIKKDNPNTTPILKAVVEDSYKRLIGPAIEREIRSDLTDKAEDGAIHVFGKNLEQLLMQPPIAGKVVLGWDPAFRTGCKLAVVDATGKVLDTTVVYPTAPTTEKKIRAAKDTVEGMIEKYGVSLISVGNGTACRESEQVIVDMLKEIPEKKVQYVITNEAGASVYSASKLATEEFPNFDVGQRSAASIARRVQDPLAELVKIDPKSIGVGQYQHDMNQKKLDEALSGVVEDSVNKVGVDLNTASASLLEYISGISKAIAKNIVAYREENGQFTDRKELLKVAKLGPKAFEQCAGFMRISGGKNPLDATSVHPESYEAASALLSKLGYKPNDVVAGNLLGLSLQVKDYKKMAAEQDPLAELVKIDPKSIGVGQYQHDMNQKKLDEALSGVVEDSVNKVGVDLNTASASLLEYISGISKAIAKNIVAYREENGQFTDRKELLKVAKLGPKAFEQCAGFMRISGGKNPLDATSVHPESYEAASALLSKLGYKPNDVVAGNLLGLSLQVKDYKKMAAELGIGEITLRDIVKELEKPARDPRDDMPKPILRSDVLEMKDLKEGMVLKGTVRNVIDFGAFVDIGVHQDGLVHISEMTERFIKHPLEAVSVGDIVDVRVIGVDMKKKRISLSMKGLNK